MPSCWSRIVLGAIILLAICTGSGLFAAEPSVGAVDDQSRENLTQILGRLAASADRPSMGGMTMSTSESPGDVLNVCRAARLLQKLPAAARYRLLRDFVLPGDDPKYLRSAMCLAPAEFPAEMFFHGDVISREASVEITGLGAYGDGVISFVEMLVQSAVEAGRLDELAATAEKVAAKNLEMADTLLVLTAFSGRVDKNLAAEIDAIVRETQRTMPRDGEAQYVRWPAYLIARCWLRSEAFRGHGQRLASLLITRAQRTRQRAWLSYLLRDVQASRRQPASRAAVPGANPELAFWRRGGYCTNTSNQAGAWPAWWTEGAGTITHVTGPEISPLYFHCPLAGTFDFFVDVSDDPNSEPAVEYGQFAFAPSGGGESAVFAMGGNESRQISSSAVKRRQKNRVSIHVEPKKVIYRCNEAIVYEDTNPSPASPWLALVGRSSRTCTWSNLQVVGKPEIPSVVHLLHGNRMAGWMSPLYRESLPKSLAAGADRSRGENWWVEKGVLHGPRIGAGGSRLAMQSWLAYHRPLQSGENLSYEFFYQPDDKLVHPCVGRVAMLLEPDGVRLHWITDLPHIAIAGLTPDHAVTVSSEQRGPKPIPLKPGEWNAVRIALGEDRAVVELNGAAIYERRLGPNESRMFGLFRHRNRTEAQVRNMVLQGPWRDHFSADQLNRLTAHGDSR